MASLSAFAAVRPMSKPNPSPTPPKRDTTFHDYVVHDVLVSLPGISSRAMFGGWGIYQFGVIFAIIIDGELYFKADAANQPDFESIGSRPFIYEREGKGPVSMSYWLVPEEVLEDRNLVNDWVKKAVAASKKSKR